MFYDGDLAITTGSGHLSDRNHRGFLRQLKTSDTPEANSLYGPINNYFFDGDNPTIKFDPGQTPWNVGCTAVSGIDKDFFNNNISGIVLPGPFQNLAEAHNDFDLWPIVGITFNPSLLPQEGNHPPVVSAGNDQSLPLNYYGWLNGSVRDDPVGLDNVSVSWTQVSGPPTATIISPSRSKTAVTFTGAGTYVFRLSGNDGTVTVTDDVTVTVGPVPVVPVAYDGFEEYAAGDFHGQNGGTGWNGAWQSADIYSVAPTASPMSYTSADGSIQVAGGANALRLTGASANTKVVSRSIANMTGDVYFSFLAARTNGASANTERICVGAEAGTTSAESGVLFGRPASGVALGGTANYNQLSVISGTDAVLGQAYFVVGKLTWDPVAERFNRADCWINPTSPITPAAAYHSYNDINNYFSADGFNMLYIFGKFLDAGDDVFLVDEIRIGQSWPSVVPKAQVGGYEAWAALHVWPEPGVDDQPNADPNRDGILNLMAYAADIPPLDSHDLSVVSESSILPGGDAFRFLFRRVTGGAEGILYSVEDSEDLKIWIPIDFGEPGYSFTPLGDNPDGDGSAEHVEVVVPFDGRARFFLRVNVKLQ